MKSLLFLLLFIANANAETFENILNKNAKKYNVSNKIQELQKNNKIVQNTSIEDRILIGNIQLSFEQTIAECLIDDTCKKTNIVIHTPLSCTPLRANSTNLKEISGTDNKVVQDILLLRKNALLQISKHNNTKMIFNYKSDGQNYEQYKELIKNNDNILDCKGCYGFFDEFKNTGAWYKIYLNNGSVVSFVINNTQLLENKTQNISIEYNIN